MVALSITINAVTSQAPNLKKAVMYTLVCYLKIFSSVSFINPQTLWVGWLLYCFWDGICLFSQKKGISLDPVITWGATWSKQLQSERDSGMLLLFKALDVPGRACGLVAAGSHFGVIGKSGSTEGWTTEAGWYNVRREQKPWSKPCWTNDLPLDFEVMWSESVSALCKPVWVAFLLLATENTVNDRNGP